MYRFIWVILFFVLAENLRAKYELSKTNFVNSEKSDNYGIVLFFIVFSMEKYIICLQNSSWKIQGVQIL